MTHQEIRQLFADMGEVFPRMPDSNFVINLWFKKLQRHPVAVVRKAFERHCETSEKAPSLVSMMNHVMGITGKRELEHQRVTETRTHRSIGKSKPTPKSKLEIAMDALGAKFVTDATAEIVGSPGKFRWSDIVSKKGWIPLYRAKVEELYQMAREYQGAPRCEDGSDPIEPKDLSEPSLESVEF